MIIRVTKLVPKNWLIKDCGKDIELFYLNKMPQNNPKKPILFPKIIQIDEKFMEGLGLFLGDGDMNRKEKCHLTYASKDKDIAKYALDFLIKCFNLEIKHVSFYIQYNKENCLMNQEWADYLGIPINKIKTSFSKRHKCECIQIQVNSVIFRKMFELIINAVLNKNYVKYPKLRRGLLRGLFAAEGNIGIDYLEKKPYISQIVFNLHINEDHIEKMIIQILGTENITYTIKNRVEKHSKEIIIYNWKNYKNLWEMNLFDLCQRKKEKFFYMLQKIKIYCELGQAYLIELFGSQDLYQKEIANLIGSWQGNVSRMIKGNHLLTFEQLLILCSRLGKEVNILKIKKVRIGNISKLRNNLKNKDFIDYLFKIKVTKFSGSLICQADIFQ